MKAEYQYEATEAANLGVKIVMSLKEWRELREQIAAAGTGMVQGTTKLHDFALLLGRLIDEHEKMVGIQYAFGPHYANIVKSEPAP